MSPGRSSIPSADARVRVELEPEAAYDRLA